MQIIAATVIITIYNIILSTILAIPVMWLWNGCLVDAVTVVHPIGFLQAVGISVLFGLLLKTTASK